MLILTHATLWNPGVLETRSLPKKFLGRVLVAPLTASALVWGRLLIEMQLLRYSVTLLPFAVTPLMARDLAVPVMQAPALMVALVVLVELKVLRLTARARAAQVGPDEAARRLDTLAFRARACLRRIAARHDLREGSLRLVVEQSELARVAPLTLVSVQGDQPAPHVVSLDAEDREILRTGLFDDTLTERDLLAVNHRDSRYIREITQEARAVSAHARLAALLEGAAR
jgi:plasmid stability protein